MFRKLLLVGLFFIPFLSYGQFLSVCDRTPQVRDAIMKKTAQIDPSIECSDDDLMVLVVSEFELLNLEEEDITSLKAGDFSGLSSLRGLYLEDNEITTLPRGVFSGLSSLEDIYLSKTKLITLPEGIFSGLSSLKHLKLSENKLTTLPQDIFSGLSSLAVLYLSRNQLKTLPEGIFSGTPSLRYLSLERNQITSLPEGIFSGLSLWQLSLSENYLTSLPESIFSGLSKTKPENPFSPRISLTVDTLPDEQTLSRLESTHGNKVEVWYDVYRGSARQVWRAGVSFEEGSSPSSFNTTQVMKK